MNFNDDIVAWLQERGATTGQVNDAWFEYWETLGLVDGAFSDKMHSWLLGNGYSGSLSDMWAQWKEDYLYNPSALYRDFSIENLFINDTFTRSTTEDWTDNNGDTQTSGIDEPVYPGRRARGFDIGAYKYGGE